MGKVVYKSNVPFQGYLGEAPKKETYRFMIVDDKVNEIHNAVVHRFMMGDVDDPDLYAAQPLYEWQKSEQGEWVIAHAIETPMWHRHVDAHQYGHEYAVTAKLKAKDYSFFLLKWGKDGTHGK
jgi:hypothetical protein